MPSCEKCWADAGFRALHTGAGQAEEYERLRHAADCSPEEQAGSAAGTCGSCGRRTLHQYAGQCMNPLCGLYLKDVEAK